MCKTKLIMIFLGRKQQQQQPNCALHKFHNPSKLIQMCPQKGLQFSPPSSAHHQNFVVRIFKFSQRKFNTLIPATLILGTSVYERVFVFLKNACLPRSFSDFEERVPDSFLFFKKSFAFLFRSSLVPFQSFTCYLEQYSRTWIK